MASSYDDADDQHVFVLVSYIAKSVPISEEAQGIIYNIPIILSKIFFSCEDHQQDKGRNYIDKIYRQETQEASLLAAKKANQLLSQRIVTV
jgi:hypothetical protein